MVGKLFDAFEHRGTLLKQLPARFTGAVLGGKDEELRLFRPGTQHQGEQEKTHAVGTDLAADDADAQRPAFRRGPAVVEWFHRGEQPLSQGLLGINLAMLQHLFARNSANKGEEIEEVVPDIEMIGRCLHGQLVMIIGRGRLAQVKMGLGHAVIKAVEEG